MPNCETLPIFDESAHGEPAVRGLLHLPANPSGDGLVLTHGAGADCNSPLLVALAREFCDAAFTVLRCDLPFRQLKPHGPPIRGSAERDQQGLRRAVELLRQRKLQRIFLGGHSYGGRQATMLAATDARIADALLLLSYPLHPPKRPDQMRTSHFADLRTPALFVSGSRDGFGTPEELSEALKLIPARTELFIVASAGHELLSKRNASELPSTIVERLASFAPK